MIFVLRYKLLLSCSFLLGHFYSPCSYFDVALSPLLPYGQETDDSLVPSPLPLSSENIGDDGIYLLENGQDALIYIGNSVNSDILQQLFGFSSVAEIPTQVFRAHD